MKPKLRLTITAFSIVAVLAALLFLLRTPRQPNERQLPQGSPPTAAVPPPASGAPPGRTNQQVADTDLFAEGLPNFDKRVPAADAVSPFQTAALEQLRQRVPGMQVEFDPITGAPKSISAGAGFLSGPNGEGKAISAAAISQLPATEAHRPTRAFLLEHQPLFGHGPEVLDQARVKREFVTEHSGLKTVVWEQQVDGIPVFEAVLVSHTTRDGKLVNLSSLFLPDAHKAADQGTTSRTAMVAAPDVSARKAVAIAAQAFDADIQEEGILAFAGTGGAPEGISGPEKRQEFTSAAFKGNAEAKLIWLPTSKNQMRLCWDVLAMSQARGEMYRVLVDAETGDPLVRRCLTDYLSEATYRVYTSESPSPFSPGHSTPLTNQPPTVARSLVTLTALNTNASPAGWINDGDNETVGNNVDAHLDRSPDNLPDLPRPQGSPFRVFDFPMDLAQSPTTYGNAAVVQLFYWNNYMHDKLYELGFTEAAGNFQSNNFGRGGFGNDAVMADAQDGGGANNANFSTPPDGAPGRMQMYLFTDGDPDRDGDFDAEVILHEYTHGLSNRRVGGGIGISAPQSRGMGEGWSDFYALALLNDDAGDDVDGCYATGGYVTYQLRGSTQNYYFGIRRYPQSTDMTKNPLTLKDIDPQRASPHTGIPRNPIVGNTANQVHNMGGVWCVTLWEARANLIKKHGFAAGYQLILQLVTDGLNLSPPNPNFLQARDGILQADLINNDGANLAELWAAFAKRGMGVSASCPISATAIGVIEAYDVPLPLLSMSIPAGVTEGDGTLNSAGQVRLPFAVATNVVVTLTSSDPSEITVPTSITVLAGETNATFALTVVDDGGLDGTQGAAITASAPGFTSEPDSILIHDNETAALQVTLPAAVTENQGPVQGTVHASAAPVADITASLSSTDPTGFSVPPSVILPAGQTSAVFTATIGTDGQISGPRTVTITAHVLNWTDGTATVTVEDNLGLNVALPPVTWENAGTLTNAGSVIIGGALSTNLTVTLESDTPGKLLVPSTVTIISGQVSATFDLVMIDNAVPDGNHAVTVTATAPDFQNGSDTILVQDQQTPPVPANPRPVDLALDVPTNTPLAWDNGIGRDLIEDGGFESGTLGGWKMGPVASSWFFLNDGMHLYTWFGGVSQPYAGAFSVLGTAMGPGEAFIAQDFFIHPSASALNLHWVQKVQNFYGTFDPSQNFRLEVRDLDDNVLAVPYLTNPGEPASQPWTDVQRDLSLFAGQTVRLAYVIESQRYYIDAHLDNIRLETSGFIGPVTNDVYFGTNPNPGPAEYVGTTTNSSWTLPPLAPATTYYWKIVAHKEGTTEGPIWRFTTTGVDHFAWDAVPDPQRVNEPFTVTVTAKDESDLTAANFTGRVSLKALAGTSTAQADFETGIWPGEEWESFGTPGILSTDYAHDGEFGLSDPSFMIRTDVSVGNPDDQLTCWVRPSTGNSGLFLGFATTAGGTWGFVLYPRFNSIRIEELPYFTTTRTVAKQPFGFNTGKWYKVEVKFLSTSSVTCNLYDSDGTTLLTSLSYNKVTGLPGGIALGSFGGFSIDTFTSFSAGAPISISPTNSDNFVNGVWTGTITVAGKGQDVVLRADYDGRHFGVSNPFDVVNTNDPPVILAHPASFTTDEGGVASFSVAVEGTPPFTYQWTFNGADLADQANTTLALANVQPAQAGQYRVAVANAFGSVLSSNAALTVTPAPPCAWVLSDMVSWWRAEGSAFDSQGENNGLLMNGVTFAPGIIGQGFKFNGSNSWVEIPHGPTLNFTDALTVEFWYKDTGSPVGAYVELVNKRPSGSGPCNFGVNLLHATPARNGAVQGYFREAASNEFQTSSFSVTPSLIFHHLAVSFRQMNPTEVELKTYLDGQLVKTSVHPGDLANTVNGLPIVIGATRQSGAYFKGVIDEIAIYRRAVSDADAAALYTAGRTGRCLLAPLIVTQPMNRTAEVGELVEFHVAVESIQPLTYQWYLEGTPIAGATTATLIVTNVQFTDAGAYSVTMVNPAGTTVSSNAVLTVLPAPPCAPVPSGQVGWWQGDKNAFDAIGGNHGTMLGNTSYDWGRTRWGFVFDGADDSVRIGDNISAFWLQNFTIEAWIKRTSAYSISSASTNAIIFGGQGALQLGGYAFGMNQNGTLYLEKASGGEKTASASSITDTNWHHVAVAKNGTNVLFYIDGVAQEAPPFLATFEFSYDVWAIGGSDGDESFSFYGSIDEVALYNRPLSSTEIQSIHNARVSGKCPIAPTIAVQPANRTAFLGDTVDFTVTANGSHPLFYQWRFNGIDLNGATNATLTLSPVQYTQAGSYSVLVSNPAGSVLSASATLTVNTPVPPAITSQPASRTAIAGDDVTFNVSATGTPTLRYQWFFNGTALPGQTSSALSLPNVQLDQAGDYFVQVTNWGGSITSATAVLTVNPATLPTILTQPSSQTAIAGDDVTFSVVATSTTPLGYQWLSNGVALPGETGSSLTLNNVQLTHAGDYSVDLTNRAGSLPSSPATLTVNSPPPCTPAPSHLVSWWQAQSNASDAAQINNGTVGGNTTFGSGRVGSGFVFDGSGDSVQLGNPITLRLQNFTIEAWIKRSNTSLSTSSGNTGLFLSYGHGGYGFGVANNGNLSLNRIGFDAVSVTTGIADTNWHHVAVAKEGTNVVFYLDGTAYPAAPYVSVFTFTTSAAIGARGDNAVNSFLGRIDEPTVYYRALSQAEIQAVCGAERSGKCLLPILPPAIVVQPASQSVIDGNPVTFAVGAVGTPPRAYQWKFQGSDIPGANSDTLTLSEVHSNDGGSYAVEVSNSAGSVLSSNAILTIVPPTPPSIISQPQSQTITAGDNVSLNVTASGTPPLHYQWLFNGSEIANATSATLILNNAQLAAAGDYSVQVTNRAGSALSSNAVLTINPPPPCASAPADLVSWWKAEGNANDVIGSNNGTVSGNVTFSAGRVGQAFVSDGSSGSGIDLGNPGSLQVQEFTIETWIRRADDTSVNGDYNGEAVIFGHGSGGYALMMNDGGDLLLWKPYDESTSVSAGVTDTQFHHVAVTKSAEAVTFYVDGTEYPAWNPFESEFEFNTSAAIGMMGGGDMDRNFWGTIDEVTVYSRPLSAGEIQAIFAAERSGKCLEPVIVTQPASQTVIAGATASFSVTAAGWGQLTYQWRFNGQDFSNETNPSLVLNTVQPAQAGNYSVRIQNAFGTVISINAVLSVVTPPAITAQPSSQTIVAGNTAILTVTATGTAPLSYQWKKNADNLDDSGNISGATTASLTVANVQAIDAANYTVVVANAAGNATSSVATLTVVFPPTITTQPGDSTVTVGGTAAFSVAATGTGPLSYQWQFNGDDIPNEVNAALALENVQLSQAGYYRVRVTNPYGSVLSSNAVLTVLPPPCPPTVSDPCIASNMFSFNITGISGPPWHLYRSTDLVNWVLVGPVTADSTITDTNIAGVPHRFYRVTRGDCCSREIGFVRITAQPGYTAMVNQLEPANNTVAGLFTPMPEGGSVPSGTEVWKWQVDNSGYDTYTNVAGTWQPHGNATMSPGEGFMFDNNSGVAFTVTFVGLVPQGQLTTPLSPGYTLIGAKLPQAGGITSVVGYTTPHDGDMVLRWDVQGQGWGGFWMYFEDYDPTDEYPAGWYNGELILEEPTFNVGESFFVYPAMTNSANRNFPPCSGQVICSAPPSDMISWWRGENNPQDAIGINDGVLIGDTCFANGRVAAGFVFDGNGDAVLIPNSPDLQLQDFTIETWIKRTSAIKSTLQGSQTTALFFGYGYGGYGFGLYDDGRLFLSRIGIDNVTLESGVTDTAWHHVAVTKSGTTVTFYIDGVSYPAPGAYNTEFSFETDAGIGARGDYADNSFYGAMDEISIYRRVLSASEIQTVYQANTLGKCAPPARTCSPTAPNLVALWRADGNASDASGYGHHGTLIGPSFNWGKVNQAFEFDSSSYVNVPSSARLKFTGPFSAEAWVRCDDASGNNTIVAKGVNFDVPVDWALAIVESRLRPHVQINGSWYVFDCATQMQPGTWHHVAMVYDGSTVKGYVNGTLDGSISASGAVHASDEPLKIGVYAPDDEHAFFYGRIDELTLYGHALSAADVRSIWQAGGIGKCAPPLPCSAPPSGAISWWKAENNAADSFSLNPGTLAGDVSFGLGQVGQAFVFDGNSDAVQLGNPTSLQLQNFTIETWMKRSSASVVSLAAGDAGILDYGYGGYGLGLFNNGKLYLTRVGIDNVTLPAPAITDTNWHHVAVTKDGTNVVFYIDGAAHSVPPYTSTFTFTTPIAIGARGDNLANGFYGVLDELGVYNRALSGSEIQAIHGAGNNGKCPVP